MEYVQLCFTGANLPASIVMLIVLSLWGLSALSGLDLDFLDLDLDVDADGPIDSVSGVGFLALRFLNIGNVPIIIWGSVFAVVFWGTSMLFTLLVDDPAYRDSWSQAAQLVVRNLVITLVATKVFTQPLRGKFDTEEPNKPEKLVGTECSITSSEVTEKFGQAQWKAKGAPLILHVRIAKNSPPLSKGDRAVIVEFDMEERVYLVTKANVEGQ